MIVKNYAIQSTFKLTLEKCIKKHNNEFDKIDAIKTSSL